MSKKQEFKVGDKVGVRPLSNRADIPAPLIPWPEKQSPPYSYLPQGVFTRVRLTEYLFDVYRQGNLSIISAAEWMQRQKQPNPDPPKAPIKKKENN